MQNFHSRIIDKRSCFSDQPITSKEQDHLKNNQYAKGLLEFIKIADAPITIGIQGGWGSGKTSLINLLQDELDATQETLCVTVNAWQQSLFASGSGGQIALGLLENAYAELYEKARNSRILGANLKDILDKTSDSFFGAIKLATTLYTGLPLPGGKETSQRPSQTFKLLKAKLNETVVAITENQENTISRIVIFVDDLDRIQPEVAVEILDVLKNLFDIEHCISVLAIDYDVVIKGLRKKFGEQGRNQREFRQYFDKIIQIPFSMPVGAYRHNIPAMLERLIEAVLPAAIEVQNQEDFIEDITYTMLRATDGVPRSIKRIINTVSLLSIIDTATPGETEKSSQHASASKELQFKILLAAVCLQVSFPDIYKALCKLPDIGNWNEEITRNTWQLSMSEENELLENLTDEFSSYDWEPSLLKLILHYELETKSYEIRDIIFELHRLTKEPGGLHALKKTLRSTNITDTDSGESQLATMNIVKEDAHKNCRQVLETLLEKIGDDRLGRIHGRKVTKKETEDVWTLKHNGLTNYPILPQGLEQIDIVLNTEDSTPCFTIDFLIPKAKKNPTLYNHILAAGFNDRGLSGWFGIDLPTNPTNSLEPNIEGFMSETLPCIQKLLDILG